jgi:hypothetical protein
MGCMIYGRLSVEMLGLDRLDAFHCLCAANKHDFLNSMYLPVSLAMISGTTRPLAQSQTQVQNNNNLGYKSIYYNE